MASSRLNIAYAAEEIFYRLIDLIKEDETTLLNSVFNDATTDPEIVILLSRIMKRNEKLLAKKH